MRGFLGYARNDKVVVVLEEGKGKKLKGRLLGPFV